VAVHDEEPMAPAKRGLMAPYVFSQSVVSIGFWTIAEMYWARPGWLGPLFGFQPCFLCSSACSFVIRMGRTNPLTRVRRLDRPCFKKEAKRKIDIIPL
jgi:hypothetical protein